MSLRFVVCLVCLGTQARSAESNWAVARSAHFEVYSHAGQDTARAALAWFEQLRTFFAHQTGLDLDAVPAVRAIGFRSAKEYDSYRLKPTSDAYYVGTETREYIVMATLEPADFHVAAHEYAHLVLHASALSLPPWLNEGLADFYSTLRITERGSSLGGEQAAHLQVLRKQRWIPLAELLSMPADSPVRANREISSVFYAESAALTRMLVLSPDYAPRFPSLLAAVKTAQSLPSVFGRPIEAIERDLRTWVEKRRPETPLPGGPAEAVAIESHALTAFETQVVTAELLLAIGRLDAAEALYRELARQAPGNTEIAAALGTIALRRGDSGTARLEWKRAIEHGASNAVLCYRYALLAQQAGLAAADVRPALERAVALNPDYDDARYTLALLEKNAGRDETALAHLRAMRSVSAGRAFPYWCATADALNQLGRREEAKAAARKAGEHAASDEERARAEQLAYIADTEMTVRFTSDAEGRQRLVTTRVPHGSTDWNPFVEPGDDYRRAQGTLREIDCTGKVTRLLVDTAGSRLWLAIVDPARVLMRNAPAEFVCGVQQPAAAVTVEYAASKSGDGVVRGLAFQ